MAPASVLAMCTASTLVVLLLTGRSPGGTVERPSAPDTETERADVLAVDFAEGLTRSRGLLTAPAVAAAVIDAEAYRVQWSRSLQLLQMDGGTNTGDGVTIEVRISLDAPEALSDHCYPLPRAGLGRGRRVSTTRALW